MREPTVGLHRVPVRTASEIEGQTRLVFQVLRPVVRLLKACGVSEAAITAAVARAFRRYARSAVRGVWLDQSSYRQLAEIVMLWARDPEFIDERGSPKKLGVKGANSSFRRLLQKAGVSIDWNRALTQLHALGSIQLCDGRRRVRLVSHVLLMVMGKRFLVAPMLHEIRRFAETIEYNVCANPGPMQARMQRWAECRSLDRAQFAEVQRFVRLNGQALLDAVDEKLSSCAVRGGRKPGLGYGVGFYVFVDDTAAVRAGKSADARLSASTPTSRGKRRSLR